MIALEKILISVNSLKTIGSADIKISGLQIDSRKIKPGNLYIAINGHKSDGHAYIDSAINQGALVIVCENPPNKIHKNVTYVVVNDSRATAGILAANWHDNVADKLTIIGVTGTNGKTTIAWLLYNVLLKSGIKTAMIGTLGIIAKDTNLTSSDDAPTSPGPLALHQALADLHANGVTHVIMEASSHAATQSRTSGVNFAGMIFSNITHDHLDYHHTFENYLSAKQLFFNSLHPGSWALVNADDPNSSVMTVNTQAHVYHYGITSNELDFDVDIIKHSIADGLVVTINQHKISTPLVGVYNAYNATAVYGAALLLGVDDKKIIDAFADITLPPGRLQQIKGSDGIIGIVDYAHSPDALADVLHTLGDIKESRKIITIIGCGGDRDRSKRPKMAYIAASHSDIAILTSDNPRSENPLEILADMKSGLPTNSSADQVKIIPDRKQAIVAAVELANRNDIILLAGKGHEDYQIIGNQKLPFDDYAILKSLLM